MSDAELIAEKVIGHSCMKQYWAAVIDLHTRQWQYGSRTAPKIPLMTPEIKALMDNVKTRKKRIAKKNFEEKLTCEFSPYACVSEVPSIEKVLFDHHGATQVYGISALRDRFCFNMTTSGILRGESLFKADLSDLCDLIHKDTTNGQEVHIMVMRIAIGKTNGLKTLYGRVMRNRDVALCPIGSLALYLFARFKFTGEDYDYLSNDKWFNAKLLIDPTTADKNVAVSDQNYARTMKKICETLHIPSNHFIHFGRSVGAVKAELEELDGYSIGDLGNWNVDIGEGRARKKRQCFKFMVSERTMLKLPHRSSRNYDEKVVQNAVNFVMNDANVQRISWGAHTVTIDGEQRSFPDLIRKRTVRVIARDYVEHFPERKDRVGLTSFEKIVRSISYKDQKVVQAVDYVSGQLLYDNLRMVNRIVDTMENESERLRLRKIVTCLDAHIKGRFEHASHMGQCNHTKPSFSFDRQAMTTHGEPCSICTLIIRVMDYLITQIPEIHHDLLMDCREKLHIYMGQLFKKSHFNDGSYKTYARLLPITE